MSDQLLLKELRSIRKIHKPSTTWRDATRQRILSLAETKPLAGWSSVERWRESWLEFRWRLSPVPVVASTVVVLMLMFSCLPFSQTLAQSQPGDWLYPVKRLEERVELGMRTSPSSQGVYYLKLADRRLQELSHLPIGDSRQAELLRDYNVMLSFAQANYQAVAPTTQLAQIYDRATNNLITDLNQVVVANGVQNAYSSARKLTKDINSLSLTTLVSLHQPDGVSSQNEVTERLQQEITKVEEQLASVQTKLERLPGVAQRSSKVVLESRQQVVPVSEAGEEATKTLAEAKELLERKEFSLALEKLKEGEVITLKTEEAIDEAISQDGEVKGETVDGAATEPEIAPSAEGPADTVSNGATESATVADDSPDTSGASTE